MPNAAANSEDAPNCTIVIPVFNRAELTEQCLAAIRENTAYRFYEVIIVDNGSTDSTRGLLDDLAPPFSAIRNDDNLGFARACNQGEIGRAHV